MRTIAKVNIWGMAAGTVCWDEKVGYAVFQYDPAFAEKGIEIAPAMMPLSDRKYSFADLGRYAFKGLPGMIADSIPDDYGNMLIDMRNRRSGIDPNSFTSIDRLCYVGRRGMGALEYEPAYEQDFWIERVDVDNLSASALKAFGEKKGKHADLSEEEMNMLLSTGTSAGGTRAKAVVVLDRIDGEIVSGQFSHSEKYADWLIKFDMEGERKQGLCRVEHAYYKMALDCGISMSECRLLETKKGTHFITERFDRIGGEKVHIQTLNAMAHYDFTDPAVHSYEQLFSLMKKIGLPAADVDEMFLRAVFNVITVNNDDHTKNIAFMLRKGGEWRLTPAYDITYAYNPENKWIRAHQLTVNGKASSITKDDLSALAQYAGICGAEDKIEKVLAVSDKWEEYAKDSSVPDATAGKINASLEENRNLFLSRR